MAKSSKAEKVVYDEHGAVVSGPEPGAEEIAPSRHLPAPIEPERIGLEAAGSGIQGSEAGTLAAMVREESSIKAALVLAKRFPRDEAKAAARILSACGRFAFAECAAYAFPRGGQTVTGPSVDLAREMARCWGNIRYGIQIVSDDEERVHIKGWALDAETNAYVEAEDKFKKLVQRRQREGGTRWVQPDERDLRELVNRRGAICVRNALLQLMPPDVVDDALEASRATVRKGPAGEKDPAKRIRKCLSAFLSVGVSKEMVEAKLQHPIDQIVEDEMVELTAVFTSIRDGQSRVGEHFEVSVPASRRGPETVDVEVSASAEERPPVSGQQKPGVKLF